MLPLLYLLFLLSGTAALVYQVAWVRSLGLVFGGSHLAVTTVLAVFMGGLALGGVVIGRRVDRIERPLRLYAGLEFGIALSAFAFFGLTRLYPTLYVPLAHLAERNPFYLTLLRVTCAVVGMLVPTTLMGGTLPVLARFVTRRGDSLGRHLSFLYGANTLGAVLGSLLAGFVLLRHLGLTATTAIAVATNLLVGVVAFVMPAGRLAARRGTEPEESAPARPAARSPASRLVLWGVGVSGFCALGYEVLWTRVLTIVVGTSVYSFTVMLVAFLTGLALGSQAFGLLRGRFPRWPLASASGFGCVQIVIGVAALAVTYALRELPDLAMRMQSLFSDSGSQEFAGRQAANFVVAFAFMFVPALFMGAAFPLAGEVHARSRSHVGGAIGEVLAYNTVGAILGAAVGGFVLVVLFGIERSLQYLVLLNVGFGLFTLAAASRHFALRWVAAAPALAVAVMLAGDPSWLRMWDARYFAIFRNNQREAFDTAAEVEDALGNTDVLFFHEGVNETISVIEPRGSNRSLLVNGKVVASSTPQDVQCQYTLGHLPMLVHPAPRSVFVLGMGTAMTLGAVSLHPAVERIVLVEIERGVEPAARLFGEWNQRVLDDPRLAIHYNDGRNFLLTTRERFDVITADPIHPWTRGSAYLYTKEYYDLAARRLAPGGVMCQWLPIYELTPDDLRTVVRTFGESFEHVLIWLTHYDAELIGSREPLVIDEAELGRRISHPPIRADLASVEMGGAAEFLSYFVMGSAGARAFSAGATVNTDDNLRLEFSAPESTGVAHLMGDNVAALTAQRESLAPYLVAQPDSDPGAAPAVTTSRGHVAERLYDRAHALFLWGQRLAPEFRGLLARLETEFPDYAPGRFLAREDRTHEARTPRLLEAASFEVADPASGIVRVEVSAVGMHVGRNRGAVVFVDNSVREIFGQRYLEAPSAELDETLARFAGATLAGLGERWADRMVAARTAGHAAPDRRELAAAIAELLATEDR